MPEALTDKQRAFCEEYLVDLNGTKAAVRAGYSERNARHQASRLLNTPEIQATIKRLMDERSERVGISADNVLEELAQLGMYDPGVIGAAGIQKPEDIEKLPADVRRAIVGWSWDKAGNFTIKLGGKIQALDLLGQHLGLWKCRVELTGKNGGPVETAPELSEEFQQLILERTAKAAVIAAQVEPPASFQGVENTE